MIRRYFVLVNFALIGLLNFACVTSQAFREDYRSKVKKVSIHAEPLPPFVYYGPGEAFKAGIGVALGGAIGGTIAGAARNDASSSDIFGAAFKKQNFDPVAAIVKSFGEDMQERSGIEVVSGPPMDAEVTIKIKSFGLGKGWGFTDQTKPFMSLTFEMKEKGGDVIIWRENSLIETTSIESAYHSSEEWLGDNVFLKTEFEKSIAVATKEASLSLPASAESSELPSTAKR